MKRILLINPPMCVNQPPTFVSFGIAYIAQELKKRHDVNILDIDGNRFSKEEVKRLIKESDSDLIAIGGLVTVYPYLHWLIPEIKKLKPGVEIVLGGPVASSLREACFKKFDIKNLWELVMGQIKKSNKIKELFYLTYLMKSYNNIKRKGVLWH